jgi:hypothetical protein
MFNFNWWKRNQRDKEWERFRNWYQMHKQAEQFTSMRCHFCRTPASSPEANYCSHCGARFHTEPGLHTTEPLPVERPSDTLRRQLQEQRQTRQLQQQQDTADAPTRKFRTVRLDRIV